MNFYAISPLIEPELLLACMCENFDIRDIPITQEIIDQCFISITGKLSQLDCDFKEFGNNISEFFENPSDIKEFVIYLQAGPQIKTEDLILRFPKIIARYY